MAIAFDSDTRTLGPGLLYGGSPGRVVKLNPAGQRALAELRAGPIRTPAGAGLARRLTESGLAHPRPNPSARYSVTVVIPVHNRPDGLARARASVAEYPTIVVDDASDIPVPDATRLPVNRGPAAARNLGAQLSDSDLIAFLDSDCVAPPGWIEQLAGHFDDPWVGAVAPRITPVSRARYARNHSPLDLGRRPGLVRPLTRVGYAPSAALIVRRSAFGDGFDEALRCGEDVDFVWRLDRSGLRVRYDPSVQVFHSEPASRTARLRRRMTYGTAAAELDRRHPGDVAPLVVSAWPGLAVLALITGRPRVATAALGAGTALLTRRLHRSGLPVRPFLTAPARATGWTYRSLGRWTAQLCWPLALLRPRIGLPLLLVNPLIERANPLEWWADEAAYGLGVWRGAIRDRRPHVVLPVVQLSPPSGRRR